MKPKPVLETNTHKRKRAGASIKKMPAPEQGETINMSEISSTLRIPLAARAIGDRLFPQIAIHDDYAPRMMAAIGDDGSAWQEDLHGIYGCMARVRCFRQLAQDYLDNHPGGYVINLGCGLSHYFQWLDNGRAHMIDADLPDVQRIRERLLPIECDRCTTRTLDLCAPDWWEALALPANTGPLFLFSEGVMMYQTAQTVTRIFATIAENAPEGSVFAFDTFCSLLVGQAWLHPSVRKTAAQFRWGPRSLGELRHPHPRLHLKTTCPVMESFGFPYMPSWPMFQAIMGVPMYAVYVFEVAKEK